MKFVLVAGLVLFSITVFSQFNKGLLMGTHMDLIKSNHDGYFEKAQIGLEANYFLSEHFTATGGLEFWTREGASAVMGTRWYPVPDAYIRLRGMIGNNNDVSIGGGWAKPISETIRLESMADFYFEGDFSIRAGFAFMLK
jgi:hypothetical protein